MSKILTRIRALQEKHKILDREVTDLEDERNGDRTSSSKFELVKKKKEKLALRDEINRLKAEQENGCLLYTSPSPRDGLLSRMPSSA